MGLVDRVGAFRTTTPTSTKFVLQLVLPLNNYWVHARHNIVGTKNEKIFFWVIYLFFGQRSTPLNRYTLDPLQRMGQHIGSSKKQIPGFA